MRYMHQFDWLIKFPFASEDVRKGKRGKWGNAIFRLMSLLYALGKLWAKEVLHITPLHCESASYSATSAISTRVQVLVLHRPWRPNLVKTSVDSAQCLQRYMGGWCQKKYCSEICYSRYKGSLVQNTIQSKFNDNPTQSVLSSTQ